MEPLSAPVKANGSDPVAWASTSPMTPPWVKTATRLVAMGGGDPLDPPSDTAGEDRGRFGARDRLPALLLEHGAAPVGPVSTIIFRNRPPSHSPTNTSRRSGLDHGPRCPRLGPAAAAVWAVRRKGVT